MWHRPFDSFLYLWTPGLDDLAQVLSEIGLAKSADFSIYALMRGSLLPI
jgi:hypothetical protein